MGHGKGILIDRSEDIMAKGKKGKKAAVSDSDSSSESEDEVQVIKQKKEAAKKKVVEAKMKKGKKEESSSSESEDEAPAPKKKATKPAKKGKKDMSDSSSSSESEAEEEVKQKAAVKKDKAVAKKAAGKRKQEESSSEESSSESEDEGAAAKSKKKKEAEKKAAEKKAAAKKAAAKKAKKEESSSSEGEGGSDGEGGGQAAGKRKAATSKKEEEAPKKKRKGEDGAAAAEDPELLSVGEWRKVHEVTVTGGDCPAPYQRFEDAGLNPELLSMVKEAGFKAPSSIQCQCWPVLAAGKDLIAVAKTGSGKTCGFLFPAFMLIRKTVNLTPRRGDGPVAVCLAPTRELAVQIEAECTKFGKASKIVSACVYGGMPKGPQIRTCMGGVHVVIGTPGRFNDLLAMTNPPVIPLDRVQYLVLDEADRMLDMGFEPQIKKILEAFPKDRPYQSVMFTATWPKAVQALASAYLKAPIQVSIGAGANRLTVNGDIEQVLYNVPNNDKVDKMLEVFRGLKSPDDASVIVFCNRKHQCDFVANGLSSEGWAAVSIHGDKDQWERTQALERFTRGQFKVIVATDVAARGLDIKGVSHVINFDFPTCGVEDWVHRVGRTGRAGAKGVAYTFFNTADDRKSARELVGVLRDAKKELPDWLEKLGSSAKGNGKSRWSSS